jgi:E3 ubiquitin-protein ligase TRIP12
LVQDAIVGSGITRQITAFREGFNGLFAIDDLKLLTHTELVSLFGKADEDWSYATLAGTMRADHGFTMDSDPVRYLVEILSDFSDVEKRQFLQFTTGSPRLPIGGWKALRPVFTVVRKIPEAPLTADDYLPSVMTCANYFKMPAYTSKEIMRQRLLTSMEEGQNSFLLS